MPAQAELTHRQEQLVNALVHGDYPSMRQAAKSIDMQAEHASRMVKYGHVQTALEQRKAERLDKAGGILRTAERMVARFTKQLDQAQLSECTAIELAQLQRNAVEVYSKTLEIRDKFNLDKADSTEQHYMYRQKQRRFMQRCVALGKGYKLLGYSIPHTTTAAEKG